MKNETYKIVDTFNGFSDYRTFSTREKAEEEIEREAITFHEANPGGAQYMRDVVPSTWTWYHDGRNWIWGE